MLDLGRWLLIAVAAAAAAGFLLRALGRAMSSPAGTVTADQLLWCLPPLVAVTWFAAVGARALPAQRPERMAGLVAAGAGPTRIRLLIAGEIAFACAAGGLAALLLFLVLRNDIAGPGLAPEIGMGVPLPPAAPVALLTVLPVVAALSAALAVPVREELIRGTAEPAQARRFGPVRTGLAGGLALTGTLVELYGLRPAAPVDPHPLTLAADLGHSSPNLLLGWAVAALGLALLTGPLLALAGQLLALGRPSARRLLAGRGLAGTARGLGTPLAVLAFTVAVVLTSLRHWVAPGAAGAAVVPAAEALLVTGCALAAVIARLTELRAVRAPVAGTLRLLGASPHLLLGAAVLRWLVGGTVLLATGGLTAVLAAGMLS
ncbi:hypothetical protein ACIGXM_32135 [Kitasatospora sp. NPDC052896]|uniref:hypothetical protein n=1 Tax=Kitasatospora sp. NPDC052896 TaxID=3364061 RepID=UPI0037CAD0F8